MQQTLIPRSSSSSSLGSSHASLAHENIHCPQSRRGWPLWASPPSLSPGENQIAAPLPQSAFWYQGEVGMLNSIETQRNPILMGCGKQGASYLENEVGGDAHSLYRSLATVSGFWILEVG